MTALRDMYHDDDNFTVPKDILKRARRLTKKGKRLLFTPVEILQMMDVADRALNGDSNDDEHDALFTLREELSEAYEDPDRWE